MQLGLITDHARVPDPDELVGRFQPEFEKLLYQVLLEPWSEAPAQQPPASPPRRRQAKSRKSRKSVISTH
ncbi:MAG: hypothetical protein COW56_00880 [Rhodocyclales bacterium CG17_big_fil_post_rev_8_21_14_2_50_68_7]|nr:MAG: hypothetical protein COW56_00880 [Rhodocyclales bacterium CG17_big_fil_post_rev_8_21_14_2_50_68_7]